MARPTHMRRLILSVSVVIIVGLAVWWELAGRAKRQSVVTASSPAPAKEMFTKMTLTATPVSASDGAGGAPEPSSAMQPPETQVSLPASGPREQQAFRFVMKEGQLTLEAVEEIRGDFHRRRGDTAWQPGMLCCRLLDAAERVLAEEIIPAPDQVCIVLDPNRPDAEGRARPAQLTTSGPVVFQVRLPKTESATQLKIYRLAGVRPAALDDEPPGQLLATIPLVK